MSELTADEIEACRIVENLCRSLGKDCKIMFLKHTVSVAPDRWAGDSTGKTLGEALADALYDYNNPENFV